MRSGRSRSRYASIQRAIKESVVITGVYLSCHLHTKFCQTSCCQDELYMQRKLLGIINMDFNAIGQLLTTHSAFIQ